mgnify:CR=1 FL=1
MSLETAQKHRAYPTCCTSAFCGRIDCTGCRNLSVLEDFKAWVKRHEAVCEDPVWCPTVFTAKKGA